MRAEEAEHPPGAGGGVVRRIVIEHDAAAVAQAERLHAAGEFLGRGQHRGQRVRRVGEVSKIHEYRAGNMLRLIFRRRVARRFAGQGGEIGGVDDPEVVRAQLVREPFRRNQRVHVFLLTSPLGSSIR